MRRVGVRGGRALAPPCGAGARSVCGGPDWATGTGVIVVWGAMSVSFGVSRSLRRFGYKSRVMPGRMVGVR